MIKRILTVCIGNICRSPTAEYVLRQRLAPSDAQITSAGLHAMRGKPMAATALDVLGEHGIDGTAHRARQLTPAMLRGADLVLAAEKSHLEAMIQLVPEARGKIFLLDHWVSRRDIPDPYMQERGDFVRVFGMIEEGVDSWLLHL